MSLLSFLLAQLWGNYMFWRIICQILGWKTTWKPFGKVCCYLCYCTALQQTIMIQCHFFWSKSMHQVKFSLEKWLFNPSYLIWFKRYAAAKRISPSTATFRQIIFWCIFCKLMLHNHVKLMEYLKLYNHKQSVLLCLEGKNCCWCKLETTTCGSSHVFFPNLVLL